MNDEFGRMRCGLASGKPTIAAFVLGADDKYDKKKTVMTVYPDPKFDPGTSQTQIRNVAACVNLFAVIILLHYCL